MKEVVLQAWLPLRAHEPKKCEAKGRRLPTISGDQVRETQGMRRLRRRTEGAGSLRPIR